MEFDMNHTLFEYSLDNKYNKYQTFSDFYGP